MTAAALTTLLTTSCGDPEPGPEPGGCTAAAFPAPFTDVDPCSAEAVLTAATAAVFSYRPAEQTDQRAAFRTARLLMDPGFATRTEPAAMVWAPITGALWQQWTTSGTTVTATARVTGDDHPADTATTSARVLTVTARPSDGGTPLHFTVYTHATRPNPAAGWQLSGLEVPS
ncbi:hypothetical protein [Nocardia mexicana]|uniref:hypothetical protein n=1 Tax=Nocardia mexicana TaxID=279262 RepID=UPI000832259D|nr:hypothetical protein [Nocardia mexicana]